MIQTMLAIAGLGTPELVIIVLVIFLLFGATRLPQLAKALGQSKKRRLIKALCVRQTFDVVHHVPCRLTHRLVQYPKLILLVQHNAREHS